MNPIEINAADLNEGNIPCLIDELILRNYIYNRGYSPDISVEKWAKIYGENAFLYEKEYQRRSICTN